MKGRGDRCRFDVNTRCNNDGSIWKSKWFFWSFLILFPVCNRNDFFDHFLSFSQFAIKMIFLVIFNPFLSIWKPNDFLIIFPIKMIFWSFSNFTHPILRQQRRLRLLAVLLEMTGGWSRSPSVRPTSVTLPASVAPFRQFDLGRARWGRWPPSRLWLAHPEHHCSNGKERE